MFNIKSQNSFDFRISNSYSETVFSLFENNDANYIILGARTISQGQSFNSLIIKFSNPEDISILQLPQNDESSYLRLGFQRENNNYFFIGSWYISNDSSGLYLRETSSDFETVIEKFYDIPFPYAGLEVLNYVIDNENNIVISGKAYYQTADVFDSHLYICKIDMTGQLISSNIPAPYRRSTSSSLLICPDNSGYYLIGESDFNTTLKEWVKFDNDLNVIEDGMFDWDHGLSNTSAMFLPNNKLIVETQWNQHESIALFDKEFGILRDTILLEGIDYLPFQFNSVDYSDAENIWITSYNDNPWWLSGTNFYHVFIFDSLLNLKGVKYFGGDMNYFMLDMIATSDGGCLISGIVADGVGNTSSDIIIRKLMPDDILTSVEQTYNQSDKEVEVYPTIFRDKIIVETTKKDLYFKLISILGEGILTSEKVNSTITYINVDFLKPGFYIYSISNNNQIIKTGKLIKQ